MSTREKVSLDIGKWICNRIGKDWHSSTLLNRKWPWIYIVLLSNLSLLISVNDHTRTGLTQGQWTRGLCTQAALSLHSHGSLPPPPPARPGDAGEDRPVRQAGPWQPVHLQGGEGQVDQEGAQVPWPGDQRQEEADHGHPQRPRGHGDQQGEESGAVQRQ